MRRSAIILLIVGLIIESVGYMIDKADVFIFIVHMISPRYVLGEKAIASLKAEKELMPDDPGFSVVEHLFKQETLRQNPPELVQSISVMRMNLEGAGLAFGTGGVRPRQPLRVTLSNGQTVDWDINLLQNELDNLKLNSLTTTSVVVFVLGILFQIVGFIIEQKGRPTAAAV
jgi:hypothetical protein